MKILFTAILLFCSTTFIFSQLSNTSYINHLYTSGDNFVSSGITTDINVEEIPDEKSPWLAFFMSYMIPGSGQIYNGQVVKGLLFMTGIAVGFGMIILAYPGADFEPDKNSDAVIYTGFGIAGALYIWQLIDAPVTASSINEERKMKLNRSEIEILPQVSNTGYGFSIRIFIN